MIVNFSNPKGNIIVADEVIAKIAGLAVLDCYGVVGMATKNVRDGLVHLLKSESLTKGIKIHKDKDSISLDIHIIVDYGTNISAIADTVIQTTKYQLKEYIGMEVSEIKVYVEGVRVDG